MERITLAEAAGRAGVPAAILRKRAQRGTLPGAVKLDGAWYVEAPGQRPEGTRARPAGTPDGRDTDARADARWAAQVAGLERENARLWGELEARRGEVRELHTLLAQAQARSLPAAAATPADHPRPAPQDRDPRITVATNGSAPRRWWQRWRG